MTMPIYLDCHATTRVDPRVLQEMLPYFSEIFGNASSKGHPFGWDAQEAVDIARGQVAVGIGARTDEIIFTSGATESSNLAIAGTAGAKQPGGHIITWTSEHKATLDACMALQRQGIDTTFLDPEPDGRVSTERLEAAFREDTILVSLLHVNNEIGVIQDIERIGAICKERNVWFHVDAAQALGRVAVDVEKMSIDLMSMSAHKVYGPKGVGALYVRRRPRVRPRPIIFGGGHERGLRSGTLNVPGIVGFGKAVAIAEESREKDITKTRRQSEHLLSRLRAEVGGIDVHGSIDHRVAGNLNFAIDGVEAEMLILRVQRRLAFSTGSACTSLEPEPSHVLRAIGVSARAAHSSIRLGIGRFHTDDEIDKAADILVDAIRELRK